MGATHQPIGQTAAACDWPEPMNADRQCRQTPNLAPGVFGQRPHRWVCHRGRTNITLGWPGWKPLQGSANDRIPGWAPSPCRYVPAPRTRSEVSDEEETRTA